MRKIIYLRTLVILFVIALFSISLAYGGTSYHKLDINRATVKELVSVKGIGKAKARAVLHFIGERKVITDYGFAVGCKRHRTEKFKQFKIET